jgi:hypothetical protein
MDDFADYLDKARAHAVDPNAFVQEDGKLFRAMTRKERNQRFRAKNRPAEVARTKAWKAANPGKVEAQKERRSSRDYHRPFVAVDFEGRGFPGFDEVDAVFLARVEEARKEGLPEPQLRGPDGKANANAYPLHRATLCAAGGWKRKFTAEAIATGLGSPTEGAELKPEFLEHEDGSPLHSDEIIEFLLSLPGQFDRNQGFTGGVNFISYAFNYDATQVLADVPREKVWEITRKKSFKSKRKIKLPTFYRDYAIDFLKGKWLKLWKLRDPNRPYKEKLDKDGNVKLKAEGKPEMEIDAIAHVCIDDAFGFYQGKFTKAIKPLVSQKYVEKKDYDEIEDMKENRDEFDTLSDTPEGRGQIRHYCNRELVCLSKALTVLRSGFDKMGETDAAYEGRVEEAKKIGMPRPVRKRLWLRSWNGAGAAAGAKIRHEELNKKHYSPCKGRMPGVANAHEKGKGRGDGLSRVAYKARRLTQQRKRKKLNKENNRNHHFGGENKKCTSCRLRCL